MMILENKIGHAISKIERLLIKKKIYSNNDTYIFEGKYYGKNCIIKRISLDLTFGIKSKVLREITFLKNVQHPNIVKLYDVIQDDEFIYIILEKGVCDICLLDRTSLINNSVLDNVITALKYMEIHGYIHGDLSFRNIIMFENFGKICFKLIDFGSSTKIYRLSAIKKPTFYISPIEILECEKANIILQENSKINPEKIDSWAFGCLSYYVNTGDIVTTQNIYDVIDKINLINTDIKQLLSIDVNDRITIGEYYDFTDYYNPSNVTKKIKSLELFKKSVNNSVGSVKNLLLESFLQLDIINLISIENIFLTFELLNKIKYNSIDDYITKGFILFQLTTKLITLKDFKSLDILQIINKNITIKIKSTDDFNNITLDILNSLNWDIDIQTQISLVINLGKEFRLKYILISLAIISDDKLNVFSNDFLHEMILLLIRYIEGDINCIASYNNPFLASTTIRLIINSINKINSTKENNLYKLIKIYFKNNNSDDFLNYFSKINL